MVVGCSSMPTVSARQDKDERHGTDRGLPPPRTRRSESGTRRTAKNHVPENREPEHPPNRDTSRTGTPRIRTSRGGYMAMGATCEPGSIFVASSSWYAFLASRSRLGSTFPDTGSVPRGLLKSRMCGSGLRNRGKRIPCGVSLLMNEGKGEAHSRYVNTNAARQVSLYEFPSQMLSCTVENQGIV